MWAALAVALMQFARFSDADLVDRSEVIVVAELIGHTQLTLAPSRAVTTYGVLQVREALKGAVPASNALLLLEQPTPGGPISSSDIRYRVGQSGLWFLRVRTPGDVGPYLADHPQRFVPTTDKSFETLKALSKAPRKP
jgi:hypothetical protein